MFTWIRKHVCAAILAGVEDAMQQLGQDATAPERAEELRERLALPLAEETPRRKKGA